MRNSQEIFHVIVVCSGPEHVEGGADETKKALAEAIAEGNLDEAREAAEKAAAEAAEAREAATAAVESAASPEPAPTSDAAPAHDEQEETPAA